MRPTLWVIVSVALVSGGTMTARAADPAAPAPAAPTVAKADANDPSAPHAPGIYYYSTAGGQQKMTKVEAIGYGKTKQGFAFFALYGQKSKTKAVIPGGHAPVRLAERRPVFYFYFGQTAAGLGENASNDPADYELSAMEVKDKGTTRRLVIGKAGLYGGKSQTVKNAAQGFASEKIADGVFKVTMHQNLEDGEYCFFRLGAGTVFDFGIGNPVTK